MAHLRPLNMKKIRHRNQRKKILVLVSQMQKYTYAKKEYHTSEVAKFVGTSPNTIRNWIKYGKVPYIEHRDPRGHLLFTGNDINNFLSYKLNKTPQKKNTAISFDTVTAKLVEAPPNEIRNLIQLLRKNQRGVSVKKSKKTEISLVRHSKGTGGGGPRKQG